MTFVPILISRSNRRLYLTEPFQGFDMTAARGTIYLMQCRLCRTYLNYDKASGKANNKEHANLRCSV